VFVSIACGDDWRRSVRKAIKATGPGEINPYPANVENMVNF